LRLPVVRPFAAFVPFVTLPILEQRKKVWYDVFDFSSLSSSSSSLAADISIGAIDRGA
jgi:hypothetical protein